MLTVGTWVGAIATVVLALGAILTSIFAIRAFGKQAEQVRLQREELERAASGRRRGQAARVFTWVEPRPFSPSEMRPAACVRNTSQQPIYNISMGWGTTGQQRWPVLLPEGEHVIPGAGSSVADGTVPIWIEFRDAAGVSWRTTSRGELTEV